MSTGLSKKNWFLLGFCILLCLAAGFIGSRAMNPQTMLWYSVLHKSPLNPPNWVFAPVWTILYIMLGIVLFLILKNRSKRFFFLGLLIFLVQLCLNVLWTHIFFGDYSPKNAYLEILALDAVVLILIPILGKISLTAQKIMIPYVVWLGFATYLNWYVAYYN